MEEEIKTGFVRISNILSCFSDFSGIDEYVLENKKNLGIRVHEAINEHIDTYSIFVDLQEQDRGYFESWKSWYENDNFSGINREIVHNEVRLYDDKRMITGKIDGIWKKDGALYLIDWKTSASENKLTWPLQAALYLQLIRKNKLCECSNTVYFIKLDKNGAEPKECCYEITDFHFKVADWAVKKYFKALATGYN